MSTNYVLAQQPAYQPASQPTLSGGTGSVADSGDNTTLSGLTGMFSAVGSAFSNAYRAVNPVVQTNPNQGQLIYNPATNTYQSTAAIQAQGQIGAISPLLLLIVGAVVVYLLVRK